MVRSRPITNRADWLSWRRSVVGASETGALFGLDPHKTALDVYLSKTQDAADTDTPDLRRGRMMEQVALAAYAEECSADLKISPAFHYDDELCLGCTPDALAKDHAVEAKVVLKHIHDNWDGPPIHFLLQTLAQVHLLGLDYGMLAVLVFSPQLPLFTYRVERNDAAFTKICTTAKAFMQRVAEKNPPAADYARDGEAITKMFPRGNGQAIDWSRDNRVMELVGSYNMMSARKSLCEKACEAIGAEIKEKMGDFSEALLPNGKSIKWATQKRKEYIVPAAEFRVLRIPRSKETDSDD